MSAKSKTDALKRLDTALAALERAVSSHGQSDRPAIDLVERHEHLKRHVVEVIADLDSLIEEAGNA